MIKECGQVIRFDSGFVWVKTIRQTTCNACQARHGCGQKLLNRYSASTADIKARMSEGFDQSQLQLGDEVEIGVDERAVVLSSMLTYGVPVLSLILGVVLSMPFDSDVVSAGSGFFALLVGAIFVRWLIPKFYCTQLFEPVVLERKAQNHQAQAIDGRIINIEPLR